MKKFASALLAALVLSTAGISLAESAVAAPPPPACKPAGQGKPPYPPGQCKKESTSLATAQPGQSQTVTSGDGEFTGGSAVSAVLVNCATNAQVADLGSTTATSLGGASVNFIVPNIAPGQYCVQYRGTLNGATRGASTAFAVTLGSGSVNLPRTGTDVLRLVGTGSGMVLLGAGVVFLARRRRGTVLA